MNPVAPAIVASTVGWLAVSAPAQRLTRSRSRRGRLEPGRWSSLVEDDRRRTTVCIAGCAALLGAYGGLFGGVLGAIAGLVVSQVVGRLEPASVTRERAEIARDLPLAVDLMAACAEVGLPLQVALPQVSRAVGGPLERRFLLLQARWDLGASPVDEWRRIAADPALQRLGLAMVRAHRSGAPVVSVLSRLSADLRRERRSHALAAARSVGVRVAGPLAVCFLPAFMVVGVVPTIVGGFTHLGL